MSKHNEVIFKNDGEHSIVVMADVVAALKQGKIVPEVLPPIESKANGAMERAIITAKNQMRTLKAQLEHNLGQKLEPNVVILQWLVR